MKNIHTFQLTQYYIHRICLKNGWYEVSRFQFGLQNKVILTISKRHVNVYNLLWCLDVKLFPIDVNHSFMSWFLNINRINNQFSLVWLVTKRDGISCVKEVIHIFFSNKEEIPQSKNKQISNPSLTHNSYSQSQLWL